MQRTDVLVVGAGPAGLMLAAELGLAGVTAAVIERNPARPGFCRGFNLNARSLDLLSRRGLAERFLAEGWTTPQAPFVSLPVPLELDGTATDHPYTLGIPQTRVEELLELRVRELGVPIHWGHELVDLEQDDDGVTATVSTSDSKTIRWRAGYLVGCDGGRSTVRRRAGIEFRGTPATRYTLLGDVGLADPDELSFGFTSGPHGTVFVLPRPDYVRVVTEDPDPPSDVDTPVTLDELNRAVDRALGRHVRLVEPRWLTRFGDAARQAGEYVRGRVLLAGDAAHIHPPAGAVGVNVALDDAMNLGWKLAAACRGWAPPDLLDTYHVERHAAGAHVLCHTRAQMLLGEPDDRLEPLRTLLTRLLSRGEVNRAFAEAVVGLDTRYDMPGTDHPWLGRMVPDLPLATTSGPVRLAELLHRGRGVLVELSGERSGEHDDHVGWRDRVDRVVAGRLDASPGADTVRALLVRPDGHAVWVESDKESRRFLRDSLTRWFGQPDLSGVG